MTYGVKMNMINSEVAKVPMHLVGICVQCIKTLNNLSIMLQDIAFDI